MRLVAYDMNKLSTGRGFAKTKNLEIIEEFVDSGMDCAKVEDFTQKNADVCANGLNQSIKRFSKKGIKAISRNGEVFLIKIK